jgi:hypothetical protein
VTRRETPEQLQRRQDRDRVSHARARARAGRDPGQIPGPAPASRRVILPVSRTAQDWKARAACQDQPPQWFDAQTGQDAARALAVCAGCPVRRECFLAAAADRVTSGVWGRAADLSAAQRPAAAS